MTRRPTELEYRRALPADAESFVRLMSDESVIRQLLQQPYPSAAAWRTRLEAQVADSGSLHLVAVHEGEVVGSAGVFSASAGLPRLHHVARLGMSVARTWQGQGVGSELMHRLLDWADRWTPYLRIQLDVFADNRAAIALYEKFGFLHEGCQRASALRDGRYEDCLLMARLHPAAPQWPR
ncbi:MAG: GNAT family N-acetyltransferase [Burkholderiaceae bacterium]